METKSNISIKEIADICGCSTATVSRVLNNTGRFSEETRKKVLNVVQKFNYQTNMVAKSLRTNKSQIIGVIVPDITNEFFASIVLAIETYCFPSGYSVFVCNTNEDENKERGYLRDLVAKGVDGIIYISGMSDSIPSDSSILNIPIVCIDRKPLIGNDIVCIQSDNYKGGFIATETLIKKGCRNIVILKDYRKLSTGNQRYSGYIDALNEYKIPINTELMQNINVSFNSAKEAIDNLLNNKVYFDGIFAATDWMAMGALTALKEKGIDVPGKVKIVGFDNITISKYSYPPISTIHQDKDEMGKTAAEVILKLISSKECKLNDITIPVELILRETT
jgi:LacI family transcriptional regulator